MKHITRTIISVFLCLFITVLFSGCSAQQKQPNTPSSGVDYIENTRSTHSTECQMLNPFEGVAFTFSGWDGYGTLTIETNECSPIIKENFVFQLEDYTNGELSNGQIVTIRAIYDTDLMENQNYIVETNTISVDISGLTELVSASNYSEDKAWIQYSKGDMSYLACIDKAGTILFQFEDGLDLQATLFSNGYAHITNTDGTIYVIDANGAVTSKYSPSTTGEVLAYGDGYTFTKKHISDFDEAYDMYYIYDYSGSIIHDFWVNSNGQKKEDAVRAAKYCGEGVFSLDIRYGSLVWYYCAGNGTWVDDLAGSMNCMFYDEIAWVDSNASKDSLVYLTSTGEVQEIALPSATGIDWNWFKEYYVNDGVCLIWLESINGDYMLNYDFATDSYSFIDENYLSKIDWDSLPGNATYENGYIVIPMKGSDGKSYYAVFDKQWNVIVAPTVYSNLIGFSEDRLIVKQNGETFVYDFMGNLTFTLSEKNISSISPYSDSVAYTSFYYYVDLNGNILFDDISVDDVAAKNLDSIS